MKQIQDQQKRPCIQNEGAPIKSATLLSHFLKSAAEFKSPGKDKEEDEEDGS